MKTRITLAMACFIGFVLFSTPGQGAIRERNAGFSGRASLAQGQGDLHASACMVGGK